MRIQLYFVVLMSDNLTTQCVLEGANDFHFFFLLLLLLLLFVLDRQKKTNSKPAPFLEQNKNTIVKT